MICSVLVKRWRFDNIYFESHQWPTSQRMVWNCEHKWSDLAIMFVSCMWPISEKSTFLWTFQLEMCVVNGNILFMWIYWNTNSSIWKHVRLLHLDFHCFVDRSIFDIELSFTHTPISVGDLNNVKQLIDFISTCPSIFVKFEKCRTNAHTQSICPEKKTKSLVYNMQRKWLKSVYSWIFAQRTKRNKTLWFFISIKCVRLKTSYL